MCFISKNSKILYTHKIVLLYNHRIVGYGGCIGVVCRKCGKHIDNLEVEMCTVCELVESTAKDQSGNLIVLICSVIGLAISSIFIVAFLPPWNIPEGDLVVYLLLISMIGFGSCLVLVFLSGRKIIEVRKGLETELVELDYTEEVVQSISKIALLLGGGYLLQVIGALTVALGVFPPIVALTTTADLAVVIPILVFAVSTLSIGILILILARILLKRNWNKMSFFTNQKEASDYVSQQH